MLCVACGSSGSGSASVSGSVDGTTLNVVSSTFSTVSGNGATALALDFASFGGLCADINDPNSNPSGTVLQILLYFSGSVTPGTYSIDGSLNTAQFGKVVAGNGNLAAATGGNVVITSASATAVSGSFTLTFANNQTLTGTFTSAYCALPTSTNNSNNNNTSSITGSGTASGSAGGVTAVVNDGTFASITSNGNYALFVFLSESQGVCQDLENNTTPTGASLELVLTSDAPLTPGTYDIGNINAADFGYLSGTPDGATSGTVTLSTVSASSVVGGFNLTFSDGSITGTFTVSPCAGYTPGT